MMECPSRKDRTLSQGEYGTVEYAVRANGRMEAQEWLTGQDETTQRSFAALFDRLVTHGQIKNETQFRRLDDNVWEFKRKEHRVLCYQLGSRWLLTHRIKKAGGSGKCPKSAIGRADTIGCEHQKYELREAKKKKRKKGGR